MLTRSGLWLGEPSRWLGSSEALPMPSSGGGDCGRMTILVVEDEFIVRENIASFLRDAGCVVVEAENGRRAIAMCSSDSPVDVLFTDIQLNDSVDGWEVAEAFRTTRGNIPVIYTSGNQMEPARGVSGSLHFNKPYQPADILRACERFNRVWLSPLIQRSVTS
jgi:CheY-like chemotaxis protein